MPVNTIWKPDTVNLFKLDKGTMDVKYPWESLMNHLLLYAAGLG